MVLNFKLDVVYVGVGQPKASVAGVASGGTAGLWHSDWFCLFPDVGLADEHHTHVHADVAPL